MNMAPKQEIITDMLDMVRGVQNPLRGIFLRHYLTMMVKDKLIDDVENFELAKTFFIDNFIETNKLWVRMQYQGAFKEREKRTTERKELQTLVGGVLMRLGQLEGLDKERYKTVKCFS